MSENQTQVSGKWTVNLVLPDRVTLTKLDGQLQVLSYSLLHERFWFIESQHPCANCSMTYGEETYSILLKHDDGRRFTCVKCNYCESTSTFDHKDLEGHTQW